MNRKDAGFGPNNNRKWSGNSLWAGLLLIFAICLGGCTAAQHRRVADKEVYNIVQQVEEGIFGKTNAFTIDTPYSHRKPDEILARELIEDRAITNARVLTIEDSLDLAMTQSRRFQAEKERLYLTALSLSGQWYQFSPQFFAETTATYRRDPEVVGGNVRSSRRGTLNSAVGVSQFLKTGGRISGALANDVLRFYTGNPRKEVVSVISLDLVQPLLSGFGKNNPTVEALTQAERNVVYAIRSFNYFQNAFAVEIVADYFDLLAQQDVIRNRYTNYLSRLQSTERLQERARDREQISNVDQARQAELTAMNNYVNSVASYQTALDQFKIKLGLPLGEKVQLDASALAELERNGLVPVPLDKDQAFRLAVEKQMVMLNAIDQFEDSKRKVKVAANQLLPDLNLFANTSLESDGPTDYTRFNIDDVRYSAGLQLDLPIDRLRERNNYRATLIDFEADLRTFTLALDTLKDSIERGLRNLEQRRQNFIIQKNALELANRRVESSVLLQQAGRAEVRDIVEAQDAQIAAQNAVTSAMVSYQILRLQLMLDIGALRTEPERFWLQDHLAWYLPPGSTAPDQVPDARSVAPPETFLLN